jgi:hypothetical protein
MQLERRFRKGREDEGRRFDEPTDSATRKGIIADVLPHKNTTGETPTCNLVAQLVRIVLVGAPNLLREPVHVRC